MAKEYNEKGVEKNDSDNFFANIGKQNVESENMVENDQGMANELLQKRFECLNNTIENMNIHFNNILKDNEEKYILAFNTYMYDVQKEIRILKNIVKQEKIKQLKDEKVKKLQKELKWYINECLRLDNFSEFLKKEAEKWKRNSELMKNHMIYLEEKLSKAYEKFIKKGSIKKEISKIKNEKNENINNIASMNDDCTKESISIKQDEKQKDEKNEYESKLKRNEKGNDKIYKELDYKIKNLEKKLKKQITLNCSLQQKLTKHYIEKSKYEKLFVDCAQQIKKDLGKLTMSNDKEKYIDENFLSLINESKFSYFTKDDKKKLLISFFSSNDLINLMKKLVFSKEQESFNLKQKNSYPSTRITNQKMSDISPFIL
ncbi:conserved Plasmodium protein, unknown function [Plasmodium berghei]|uniref:Uncharacterized protein n=3 Tax=Plasmodium berghei TaxID=5821 RepID=A0A509AJ31_PLABA|nr:conserved Plasmodium protein, unknown function [Plasmodium berghei ANKA]CXH80172.1 conserved Plasmodium protein, unknown function [Plasmodium berghei]SCN21544.1 conserved Plasmodium protein, unknown function [Plasmodium berghei]SCO58785.1 conserved Plasmodium protein, unknown function [Plasmodium berghei]SCO58817.1 conserved Plasmodium protein, unknown function [Plasmodium berghei]VUC53763.1 conserved Plasmodium protein, unknown function [Plasmodium berghei ANKA]|eukprot:XP_034419627.1 conserved Plasmodium protein, unknown function [Plasmodium berghei ANKA]